MEKTFGERLKAARDVEGITQEELGYALGCSRDTIRRYEQNKSFPSTYQIFRTLCRNLKTSADNLLGLNGEAFNNNANGLAWQDIVNPKSSSYNNEIIERGKIVFNAIVRRQLNPAAIQANYPILDKSNINQMKQMLRTVLYSGSIRLTSVERNQHLEEELVKAYGLKRCYVANVDLPQNMLSNIITNEAIALLAAQEASTYLYGAQVVALLGGGVLSRWSEFLQYNIPNLGAITWVAMLAEAGGSSPVGGTANTIVSKIAHYQGNANSHLLSYINPERRETDYYDNARGADLAELRKARETLLRARAADVAMFSVGSMANWSNAPEVPPLREHLTTLERSELDRCVGDVLRRFVDIHGAPVGDTRFIRGNEDHVYSLDFDDLRHISANGFSVLVAGRVAKFAIIYAALYLRLANTLIIDTHVAQKLLDMKHLVQHLEDAGADSKEQLERAIHAMELQEKHWRTSLKSEAEIATSRNLWINNYKDVVG